MLRGRLFTQFPWTSGGAHCEHAAMWRTRTFGVALVAALCLILLACSNDAGTGRESLTVTATVSAVPSAPDAVATTRPTRTPTVTPSPTPTPAARQPWATDSRVTNVSLDGFAPCDLANIEVLDGDGQGAGGRVWQSVVLVNRGSTVCSLEGPDSASLFAEDGSTAPAPNSVDSARVILPPTRAPFKAHFLNPLGAVVTLGWGTWPELCPSRTFLPFSGVLLTFGSAGALAPAHLAGRHSACTERGVGVGGLAAFGPSPWTDPQSSIAAEIVAARPATSEAHTYRLRLTNRSAQPMAVTDYCLPFLQLFQPRSAVPYGARHVPSFAQRVEMPGCASLHALEPGQIVEFEVHFDVPEGAIGNYQLLWLPIGSGDPYFNASAQVDLR